MKQLLIGVMIGCAALASAALAQDDPIKQRQAIMDQTGKIAEKAGKMVKGELPYDAAEMAEGMKTISAGAEKFPAYFPDGSEPAPGVKTDALPEIWLDKADFDSWAAKLKTDAAKAAAAAAGGLESFQTAFIAMGQTCRGCHEKYRKK
jgi:cytochrome c556